MARDFDGTNDSIQNENGLSGIDTTTRTMFCWASMDNAGSTVESMIHMNGNALAGGGAITYMSHDDTQWEFVHEFSGAEGNWLYGTPSDNVLYALGVSYDNSSTANDPSCYIDGSLQTETEANTPTGTAQTGNDTISIGVNAVGASDLAGKAAHCAMWDVELSASEHGALGHRVHPFVIRNQSLQYYYPLHGNLSPEPEYVQQAHGTVSGATKAANAPPVELLENYL